MGQKPTGAYETLYDCDNAMVPTYKTRYDDSTNRFDRTIPDMIKEKNLENEFIDTIENIERITQPYLAGLTTHGLIIAFYIIFLIISITAVFTIFIFIIIYFFTIYNVKEVAYYLIAIFGGSGVILTLFTLVVAPPFIFYLYTHGKKERVVREALKGYVMMINERVYSQQNLKVESELVVVTKFSQALQALQMCGNFLACIAVFAGNSGAALTEPDGKDSITIPTLIITEIQNS